VVRALRDAVSRGTTFGAPTELETRLAELIRRAMPSIQMIRFVNSGTEAAMSALRLARAYTRREKILKFSGGYHGHSDGLLAKAGSGLATLAIPDSAGVPAAFARQTLIAPYNDLSAVGDLFARHPGEIAAVIVEPVAANMGVIPPRPGFLEGLRKICDDGGSLLIFDEVITGFRVHFGGAQALYGVRPDLTCLGKIIGGGLPVGAYGGSRKIMKKMAPLGDVYQAGTLSGNPLVMTAGIETLTILREDDVYPRLDESAAIIERAAERAALRNGIGVRISRVGSLFTLFFRDGPVGDYAQAGKSDVGRYARFFHFLLDHGVYFPPSQFEAAFVSGAHTAADLRETVGVLEEAFGRLAPPEAGAKADS
jgi:glutamate-1-semialdehyde 2,1-aminomutase